MFSEIDITVAHIDNSVDVNLSMDVGKSMQGSLKPACTHLFNEASTIENSNSKQQQSKPLPDHSPKQLDDIEFVKKRMDDTNALSDSVRHNYMDTNTDPESVESICGDHPQTQVGDVVVDDESNEKQKIDEPELSKEIVLGGVLPLASECADIKSDHMKNNECTESNTPFIRLSTIPNEFDRIWHSNLGAARIRSIVIDHYKEKGKSQQYYWFIHR
jgi:hypothetical protein